MANIVTDKVRFDYVKTKISNTFKEIPKNRPFFDQILINLFSDDFKYFCICDSSHITSPAGKDVFLPLASAFGSNNFILVSLTEDINNPIKLDNKMCFGVIEFSIEDTDDDIIMLLSNYSNVDYSFLHYIESAALFTDSEEFAAWYSTPAEIAIFGFKEKHMAEKLINISPPDIFFHRDWLNKYLNLTDLEINNYFGRIVENLIY